MDRLLRLYRALHEQAFVPIFSDHGGNHRREVEACVDAGLRVIEYTLRATDCRKMIPWIRREFPDLYLVVGSTIDDDGIVDNMRNRHPHLMTVSELADLGVDGFVSMLPWTEKSIRKYSPTHLIMPMASTLAEAFDQTRWGAHFQKMNGNNLDLVRGCRLPPTFDFCPIFVTGGQVLEAIPGSIEAGAMLVGSGWREILAERDPAKATVRQIAARLHEFLDVTRSARSGKWPMLADAEGDTPIDQWLGVVPHWHPF